MKVERPIPWISGCIFVSIHKIWNIFVSFNSEIPMLGPSRIEIKRLEYLTCYLLKNTWELWTSNLYTRWHWWRTDFQEFRSLSQRFSLKFPPCSFYCLTRHTLPWKIQFSSTAEYWMFIRSAALWCNVCFSHFESRHENDLWNQRVVLIVMFLFDLTDTEGVVEYNVKSM